jgi:hypothetical protein
MGTGRPTCKIVAGNFELLDSSRHNQGVNGDVRALRDVLK